MHDDEYFMNIKCENCGLELGFHNPSGNCVTVPMSKFFARNKTIVRVRRPPHPDYWYAQLCGHYFLVRMVGSTYYAVMADDQIDPGKAFYSGDLEIISNGCDNARAELISRERIFDMA